LLDSGRGSGVGAEPGAGGPAAAAAIYIHQLPKPKPENQKSKIKVASASAGAYCASGKPGKQQAVASGKWQVASGKWQVGDYRPCGLSIELKTPRSPNCELRTAVAQPRLQVACVLYMSCDRDLLLLVVSAAVLQVAVTEAHANMRAPPPPLLANSDQISCHLDHSDSDQNACSLLSESDSLDRLIALCPAALLREVFRVGHLALALLKPMMLRDPPSAAVCHLPWCLARATIWTADCSYGEEITTPTPQSGPGAIQCQAQRESPGSKHSGKPPLMRCSAATGMHTT
jgi:hypothetical protein